MQPFTESFYNAWKGLSIAWREERNFRIETIAGVLAVILGRIVSLSRGEWAVLLLTIAIVLSVEILNTALEEFCDMVKNELDPHVAKIKDLAAAAVLVVVTGAFVVGLCIFVPHLSIYVS